MIIQRDAPVTWLKPKEAQEYFKVSRTTLWRITNRMEQNEKFKKGIIRYERMVRVREDMLTEFLQQGARK